MAFPSYRDTTIGRALKEAMQELEQINAISDASISDMVYQMFDAAIAEQFREL